MSQAVLMAFQCRNCGAVEPPDSAGENPVPSACHSCRAGVGNPDNWIILSDLTEAELKKDFARHGLTKKDIVQPNAHKVSAPPKGKKVKAEAFETVGSKDRG